ncbi:MAG: GNAT family N-acyltransferase, partial [Candidatus Omnitrophota bacterium]|nr:GNAT family N-acyltransferase [Candidatus Omnitrophota bacterium]
MDEMIELIGRSRLIFRRVDTPESLLEVYRLRYEVYCNECKFLKPEQYPEGIEHDKYDPNSVQFSASDQYGIIGTMRLV